MKLYRGLKSSEFNTYTSAVESELQSLWERVLMRRKCGDWSFPIELSNEISRAERLLRLRQQHFTDRKEIALKYARENDGALVQIEVPTKDIISSFRLEFQNFSKRRRNFEIVYVIDAKLLHQKRRQWKLKVISGDRL